MNILLTCDDGPGSPGFEYLREAIRHRFRQDHVVELVPKTPGRYAGMSRKAPDASKLRPQKEGPDRFTVPNATPADVVHLAHLRRTQWLSHGQWDLVVAGVGHGSAAGLRIFQSGNVGAAMVATFQYGTCAWTFHQLLSEDPAEDPAIPRDPKERRTCYRNTIQALPEFLRSTKPFPGECVSVNFPLKHPKGWVNAPIAPFDAAQPEDMVPLEVRRKPSDVTLLRVGYVTQSQVCLNYNEPLRM